MKNPWYTSCREFIPKYQLSISLWRHHHHEVTWTLNTRQWRIYRQYLHQYSSYNSLSNKQHYITTDWTSSTADLLKRQTVTLFFIFHNIPLLLKHLAHLLTSFFMNAWWKKMLAADCWLHCQDVLHQQPNTFSTLSKLLTPNMYCWSSKCMYLSESVCLRLAMS